MNSLCHWRMNAARPSKELQKKRNTSLDVLRAAAIILVVNCHIVSGYYASSHSPVPAPLGILRMGGHGVDLFFILSGWLLGRQLCEELRDTGGIELRRFWLRRWLRTLPAYYAILLGTYLQVIIQGKQPIRYCYLWFAQNYVDPMPYFAISWSLCVEEHFYLLVAPFLLILARSHRAATVLLPIILALPLACRSLNWYHSLQETHVRYDECATGVLLAYTFVFLPRLWRKLWR